MKRACRKFLYASAMSLTETHTAQHTGISVRGINEIYLKLYGHITVNRSFALLNR